jgi:hypothetical protein
MSPFLAIADLDDGTFAIIAIDPTKRVGSGCSGIVQSLHQKRDDAASAIEARSDATGTGAAVGESAMAQPDAQGPVK